jgi:hypothetical protein
LRYDRKVIRIVKYSPLAHSFLPAGKFSLVLVIINHK